MVKDIVVNLSVGETDSFTGAYAISIASALGAHLTGVAFVFDAIVPMSGAAYIPAEVVDTQLADNQAAAKAAIDRFNLAAQRAGIAAEAVRIDATFAAAGEQFSRMARRFDLAVVGQAKPESLGVEGAIVETALFEAGRPVVIVPYIQAAPLKLDNVMVCWDGSRQATRAIADAMPLLERAGRVEIVIIADEHGTQDEIAGADMAQHLARHGLKVEVNRTVGGQIEIAEALLSHAADSDADFAVMGGYGHSRLREFVLGGVTHSILRAMTIPTLMSH